MNNVVNGIIYCTVLGLDMYVLCIYINMMIVKCLRQLEKSRNIVLKKELCQVLSFLLKLITNNIII